MYTVVLVLRIGIRMVHQGKAEGMQMSEGQSDLPAAELEHLAAEVFVITCVKVGFKRPLRFHVQRD